LNIDWEIALHPPPDSIIVHSEKFGRKDISRENKESTSLFLLKYYHNQNLFTRDDALCTGGLKVS
jgi:hypothetical protein